MVSKKDSLWIQSGIVSFGTGCAEPEFPGVYTRVSQYQNWIESYMGSNPPGFVEFNTDVQQSPPTTNPSPTPTTNPSPTPTTSPSATPTTNPSPTPTTNPSPTPTTNPSPTPTTSPSATPTTNPSPTPTTSPSATPTTNPSPTPTTNPSPTPTKTPTLTSNSNFRSAPNSLLFSLSLTFSIIPFTFYSLYLSS
ncbi:circumsporozoite protein-like [Megalobrama amblycephala]|uniref:circumsporozoite protein-like n=1 Tax=Megalobrama amblycephala TaxID=75352 RepID=UPI002013E452|nr:circumsporozoite protein-like [Megalobrama amblycephala]